MNRNVKIMINLDEIMSRTADVTTTEVEVEEEAVAADVAEEAEGVDSKAMALEAICMATSSTNLI